MMRYFAALLLAATFNQVSAQERTITLEDLKTQLGVEFSADLAQELKPMLVDFNADTSNRAMAAAVDAEDDIAIGYAFGQTEGAASTAALTQCEAERVGDVSVSSPCEIILLNDYQVPTAKQFKAPYGPEDAAFVWQVVGRNATVYLGGTFHLMKPTFYPLNAAYQNAFEASEQIALEIDPSTMNGEVAAKIQSMMQADAALVGAALTPELREALSAYSVRSQMPMEMLLQMQPAMVSTTIAVSKMSALGYLPQSGIDLHFSQRAQADKKPIIGLESILGQIELLTSMKIPDQLQLLQATFEDLQDIDGSLLGLIDAWLKADPELIYAESVADFSATDELRAFGTRMLDDRNVEMAKKITALLNGKKNTFVLVGAAHFGGDQGLINLLRQQGYKPMQLNRSGRRLE